MQTFSCKQGAEQLREYASFGGDFLEGRIQKLEQLGEEYNVYKFTLDVKEVHPDVMKQVIGRDGYYFKLTTENNMLDFIWHDMQSKSVFFWGASQGDINRAVGIIKSRIFNKQTQVDNSTDKSDDI